jgi:hypothetical protein
MRLVYYNKRTISDNLYNMRLEYRKYGLLQHRFSVSRPLYPRHKNIIIFITSYDKNLVVVYKLRQAIVTKH